MAKTMGRTTKQPVTNRHVPTAAELTQYNRKERKRDGPQKVGMKVDVANGCLYTSKWNLRCLAVFQKVYQKETSCDDAELPAVKDAFQGHLKALRMSYKNWCEVNSMSPAVQTKAKALIKLRNTLKRKKDVRSSLIPHAHALS
jgi:hypothetical protein